MRDMTRSKVIEKGHYEAVAVPEDAVIVPAGESRFELRMLPDSGPMAFALEAGARLDLCLIVLPGSDCRADLSIDILGENAQVRLSGVYVCAGEQDVRLGIQMRHKVGHCYSKQYFAGVLAGKARSVFDGRIVVAPDSPGTEAYQENHNLLVSDTAVAETHPQLEIYTDDVVCSHGATVGRLDEAQQFYMRSRGVPEAEARVLQMISFVAPALQFVPEGTERETLAVRIEEALRSL